MTQEYPKQYLYQQVVRAKLYIDEHFAETVHLDNAAKAAGFSKFHFVRLFRDIYGKTPHQYLTSVRIGRAIQLLQTDLTVKQVCFAVGFDSITSFTALFKRRIGLTPAAYQQISLERRNEIKTVPLRHIPNCFAEKKGWTKNSNSR